MNRIQQLEVFERELARQDEQLARARRLLERLGTDTEIRVPREVMETLTNPPVCTAPANGVRG